MAIQPKRIYPAQTSQSADGYPYGAARNSNSPGDYSGTPLERTWLNDLWGFLQSLLVDADINPNGLPDRVGASQYLEAVKVLANRVPFEAFTDVVRVPLTVATNLDNIWAYFEDVPGAPNLLTQRSLLNAIAPGSVKISFALPYRGWQIKRNGFHVTVKGATGHASLPQHMPVVTLTRRSGINHESPNVVASGSDTSASVTNYQDVHDIRPSMTGPVTVDAAGEYCVQIVGEYGTFSKEGLLVYGVFVDIEPVGADDITLP